MTLYCKGGGGGTIPFLTAMHGCSEAYEQEYVFELRKQLCTLRVGMTVGRPPAQTMTTISDFSLSVMGLCSKQKLQRLI